MHTILGAGGIIANELTHSLSEYGERIRLVSRKPAPPGQKNIEVFPADLTDVKAVRLAVAGSSVAYLCAGLPYDLRVWSASWPVIMENVITSCRQENVALVFFDNVYMYGKVNGPMTEKTPYHPCSKKGEIRMRIAYRLMEEAAVGNIKAMIARSADFYGPGAAKTGILNALVFNRLAKKQKALWMGRVDVPHSFTYTPDAGKAIRLLATREDAWNQVWHLPTHNHPPDGQTYIRLVAEALQVKPGKIIMGKWMLKAGGFFDRAIKELEEMLYQYEQPYLFDSSKFEKAFDFQPTSYEEGIIATAESYTVSSK